MFKANPATAPSSPSAFLETDRIEGFQPAIIKRCCGKVSGCLRYMGNHESMICIMTQVTDIPGHYVIAINIGKESLSTTTRRPYV